MADVLKYSFQAPVSWKFVIKLFFIHYSLVKKYLNFSTVISVLR